MIVSAMPGRGIELRLEGKPPTQGSMRPMRAKGSDRIYLKPSAGDRLAEFRADVVEAMRRYEGWEPIKGAVEVSIWIYLKRPRSHYRTGRNAGMLRDDAPRRPISKPDGDKVVRAIFDACTIAGVWGDDAQVTDHNAHKRWGFEDEQYVVIRVQKAEELDRPIMSPSKRMLEIMEEADISAAVRRGIES